MCRQDLDLENCQQILGEEFDLSQVIETKHLNDSNPLETEMIQINSTHTPNQANNE